MSLIAVVVGVAVALTQPLRRALVAAGALWSLTTVHLAVLGGAATARDRVTFWVIQSGILVAALFATLVAGRLRNAQVPPA